MLEGVFGQIFLVTIVALVVSNLGVERHALRHTMTEAGATRRAVGGHRRARRRSSRPEPTDP